MPVARTTLATNQVLPQVDASLIATSTTGKLHSRELQRRAQRFQDEGCDGAAVCSPNISPNSGVAQTGAAGLQRQGRGRVNTRSSCKARPRTSTGRCHVAVLLSLQRGVLGVILSPCEGHEIINVEHQLSHRENSQGFGASRNVSRSPQPQAFDSGGVGGDHQTLLCVNFVTL